MTARISPYAEELRLVQPLIDCGKTVLGMGLEQSLAHLVEIRASQINGCAIACKCTLMRRFRRERVRRDFTCWTSGANPRSTPRARRRRSAGPRR